jgi:hypothetical protein
MGPLKCSGIDMIRNLTGAAEWHEKSFAKVATYQQQDMSGRLVCSD